MKRSGSSSSLVRTLVLNAMLMALSVVIGIVCKTAFTWDVYYRVTFENFPIIISGFLFGPIWGAAVGAGADVVSCLCSPNPAVNPVITVGAAAVGIISGLVPMIFGKLSKKFRFSLSLAVSVALSHAIGQVLIKSIAKIVYFGMPKIGIVIGAAISLGVGTVEFFFIRTLLFNREIASHLSGVTRHLPSNGKE